MDITPQIFNAKVMHKRLFPKENTFVYGVYYLVLPLPAAKIPSKLTRFDPKDLGYQDGSDPKNFALHILSEYGLAEKITDIILITMPRVLGYVFNPVSFYFCLDQDKANRAVIAEVHNTFGEQHFYLCAHADHSTIDAQDWMEAEKLFHVSPFLERTGSYRFRFSMHKNQLTICIDYFDEKMNKQLITSLSGRLEPLNEHSLRKAFWSYPLVTLKAITMIHWQAIKLWLKNIQCVKKPEQYTEKLSTTVELQEFKKRVNNRSTDVE